MPTMLRHKVTGEVWCYNENLARHDDVETFESVDPQFAAAVPEPAPVVDPEPAPEPEPEPAPEPEPEPEPAPEPVVSKRKKKEEAPVVEFSTEDELADLDDLLGDA